MKDKDDLIFSLDIGTRKVVGLVAEKSKDGLKIIDLEVIEHKSRTMLDGQIHNIDEVTKIVVDIKEKLKKRLNISLSKVGVAVAGRALKTVKAKIEKEVSLNEEITNDAVRNIELEAVSSILYDADNDLGEGDYYCVGYSVVYYELDGMFIGNLTGHFGRTMAVEVIATFLPRVVLNSMLSVLRRAKLEAINLTLEPIAAINVIIPADVRRLNLALIDIGAGTSDIALTKNGMVFAYGMVSEAGDEITELICEKFILDFNTAEAVKRMLTKQQNIKFRDILGREHELNSSTIIEAIHPRITKLAKTIADCVYNLNQKIPHAVVLIGGGSLTPLFEKELAAAFSLEESNIGIRLPEMVSAVEDGSGRVNGRADMVTPLGICVMTAESNGLKFIELYVNEKRISVLDMQQNLDVLNALIVAGIDKSELYGKIGKAICVEVNGQLKVIKGKIGKPAQLKVNGKDAQLMTKVKNQDKISFIKAEDGEDARGCLRDVVEDVSLHITVNGQSMEIKPQILMNGFPVEPDAELIERASIEYNHYVEAREVLKEIDVDINMLQEREIVVRVNKEPRVLSQSSFSLLINGERANLDSKLKDGDILEFQNNQTAFYKVKDVVTIPPPGRSVSVLLNGQQHIIEGAQGKIFMNGQLVSQDEFLIDRAEIVTRPGNNMPPTVSQVLEYLSFNLDEQKGKRLKILVDGQPGGFTTPLREGTEIIIGFVEK